MVRRELAGAAAKLHKARSLRASPRTRSRRAEPRSHQGKALRIQCAHAERRRRGCSLAIRSGSAAEPLGAARSSLSDAQQKRCILRISPAAQSVLRKALAARAFALCKAAD